MEEVPASPEKQKPGSRVAIRVSVKVSGWIALEWAFGQLGRITDHRLAFFGHFTDFLLIVGVGSGHHQGDRTGIHEGSSNFVQLFEIGTQSLVGGRSCAARYGDLIGLDWLGDLASGDLFQFESLGGEGFADRFFVHLCVFAFGGDKGGHTREHDLVHPIHCAQGRTGLFRSASPTTAEGYGVSCDCRCGVLFAVSRSGESHWRHCSKGTKHAESNKCFHSGASVPRSCLLARKGFPQSAKKPR